VKKKKDVTPSPTPSRETSLSPVPMDTDAVVEKAANDPKADAVDPKLKKK